MKKWSKLLSFFVFILIIGNGCVTIEPPPICPEDSKIIALDFFNVNHPSRRSSNDCLNFPANECGFVSDDETILETPNYGDYHILKVEVDADCEGYPRTYYRTDYLSFPCLEIEVPIPQADYTVTILYIEDCLTCNDNTDCQSYSRTVYRAIRSNDLLFSYNTVEMGYFTSFCSDFDDCHSYNEVFAP